MSDVLFILGAGASKESGVPLMKEFLDVSYEMLQSNNIHPNFKRDFQNVFEGINSLKSVYAKSYLDLLNIESVFVAFEMGELISKLGVYDQDKIHELPKSIRRLISYTIDATTCLPVSGRKIGAPLNYVNFVRLLDLLASKQKSFSVITFNYDLALDYTLNSMERPFQYTIEEVAQNRFKYLKLHGSINWFKCNKCQKIIPWTLDDYFKKMNWNNQTESKSVNLEIIKNAPLFQHCLEMVDLDPVIVPPSWNKTQYHSEISDVWKSAAQELGSAEDIFIIGYSLPESDIFFRYLFALGATSDTRIKRFWIFNPDKEGNVEPRFEKIIGVEVKERYQFHKKTFSESISVIRDAYK